MAYPIYSQLYIFRVRLILLVVMLLILLVVMLVFPCSIPIALIKKKLNKNKLQMPVYRMLATFYCKESIPESHIQSISSLPKQSIWKEWPTQRMHLVLTNWRECLHCPEHGTRHCISITHLNQKIMIFRKVKTMEDKGHIMVEQAS